MKTKPSDKKFMQLALELALKGKGKTSPNPMVGSIIVKNNKVIGCGYHKVFGGSHAEVNALKAAGRKAKGSAMYVTLEPCCFQGKTPPCTDAIIKSGIKRVVIATEDLNPLNNGKGISILRKNKITVNLGVLEKQAIRINEAFNKYIKTGLPFVTVKMAQSLDGKIATKKGNSKWISSERSRQHVHRLRSEVDAILVGVNTIFKDNPLLTSRLKTKGVKHNPIKIVLDSRLRISKNARIFSRESPAEVFIVTTKKAPAGKITSLQKKAKEVLISPAINGRINLKWLMPQLAKRGISSVLIEGGGEVIASALKEKIVDKGVFFIAPKIIGGRLAPTSVEGEGVNYLNQAFRLKQMKVSQSSADILVEGYL